ncbi:MAG TPA: murein biosynthesis integral membrane protein MurJ [Marmoricola sp.]|nr:murein biosynthesis integral membrane protein MurJ [Marmoricola sp.]HNN47429.1 murein biosynthesis integral membrane protein MurJ [Marmoricola sp.]HNO38819.1 murein biosynthesis integral membrane protein MurJ [Marmoricola sp.]
MASSAEGSSGILSSSAVMAAGTVVSRLSGFVRGALLVAVLGSGLHADIFNLANTLPNMLYILLAGGVFNAVLVPQLVRAMKNDDDDGAAYIDRIITLAGIFLTVVTVVLVLAAPLVMRIYLGAAWYEPRLAEQRASAIAFARYCLPQVFFYGMFVLVGQVLNARRRFGPMMWAPIANNVVSVLVIVAYLLAYGRVDSDSNAPFTATQEALLGIGSTLGIAVQLLILVPYLRSAGVSYRPRYDFRNTGLGQTMRLGTWTVLFVLVNQVALAVVYRIAGTGAATDSQGTGLTVYQNVFVLMQVPHSVITVSLATAMATLLSTYAATREHTRLATSMSETTRLAAALVIPVYALVVVLAGPISHVVYGFQKDAEAWRNFVPTMTLFPFALICFTFHYLMLRGFYAIERNRLVFWIQCLIAATNICLAIALTRQIDPRDTAPHLVLAYGGSYLVGALVSAWFLRRRIPGFAIGWGFSARLAVGVVISAAVAWAALQGLQAWLGETSIPLALTSGILTAVVFGVTYLGSARLVGIQEANQVLTMVRSRLIPGS